MKARQFLYTLKCVVSLPRTMKEINWYHDVPNQRSNLFIGIALMKSINKHDNYFNRKTKDVLFSIKDITSVRVCYSEYDIREGAKVLLRNYQKYPNFLKKTEKLFIKESKELLQLVRQVETIKDNLSELISLFKKIYFKYIDYMAFIIIPEWSIDFVEKELKKELKKYFKKDFEEKFILLSTPRESFLSKAEKELLEIKIKKKTRKLLKDYTKKYFWIENNYIDTKYLKEDYFLKKLKKIKPIKDNIDKKRKFLSTLNDKKYRKIIALTNITELLSFIQDYRKRTFMESSYYLNKLLKKIGKKKKYSLYEMFLMFPEEIINLKKEKISKESLKKRKKKILIYYHQGKLTQYEGEKAIKAEEKIAPIKISNINIFKGQKAYKGIITGHVRVIRSVKELPLLKKGEILVTSNTTPDYVPFFDKVKAIITEKKGLTTHAAIISREMKIPCIIGIKYITIALKNNDYVEVDANKGVVKILKKSHKSFKE